MLTCASPNMPCRDYFPAASDGTLPLLSLLLALPCFFTHPSLQSEYICLCPLDFRLSLRLFDKLHRQNFRGSLLMTGLCYIARLLQPWYSCEIAQLFLMRYIYEKHTSNVWRNNPNQLPALPNGGTNLLPRCPVLFLQSSAPTLIKHTVTS